MLLLELKRLGVEKHLLVDAMSQLPDQTALAELLFTSTCSANAQSFKIVKNSLSIYELHELSQYCCEEKGYINYSNNVFDSSKDLKHDLITGLFEVDKARIITVAAAHTKVENRKSSVFDINEFLENPDCNHNRETKQTNAPLSALSSLNHCETSNRIIQRTRVSNSQHHSNSG